MTGPADFHGMDPWEHGSEITVCAGTSLGDIDLHNAADVVGVSFSVDAGYSLELSCRSLDSGRRFAIRFSEVQDLRLTQRLPEFPEDSTLFEGIDYYLDEADRIPVFELTAGGMDVSFRAGTVAFIELAE